MNTNRTPSKHQTKNKRFEYIQHHKYTTKNAEQALHGNKKEHQKNSKQH